MNEYTCSSDYPLHGITLGCTDGNYRNRTARYFTDTQMAGRMWANRIDALVYARTTATAKFATILAKLDTEIKKERKSPTPEPAPKTKSR